MSGAASSSSSSSSYSKIDGDQGSAVLSSDQSPQVEDVHSYRRAGASSATAPLLARSDGPLPRKSLSLRSLNTDHLKVMLALAPSEKHARASILETPSRERLLDANVAMDQVWSLDSRDLVEYFHTFFDFPSTSADDSTNVSGAPPGEGGAYIDLSHAVGLVASRDSHTLLSDGRLSGERLFVAPPSSPDVAPTLDDLSLAISVHASPEPSGKVLEHWISPLMSAPVKQELFTVDYGGGDQATIYTRLYYDDEWPYFVGLVFKVTGRKSAPKLLKDVDAASLVLYDVVFAFPAYTGASGDDSLSYLGFKIYEFFP